MKKEYTWGVLVFYLLSLYKYHSYYYIRFYRIYIGFVRFHRWTQSAVRENRFGRIRQCDAIGKGGQGLRPVSHIHRHANAGRHPDHLRDGQSVPQLLCAVALCIRVPNATGRGQPEYDQDAPQVFPEHDHWIFRP